MYLRNIECQPQKMRILNGRILKIIFITEQLRKNYESAESDRKLLITEMQRLRTQYEDLIKQLEQTQVIVDQQKVPVLSWYTLSPRTFFQLVYCTSEYSSSQKLLDWILIFLKAVINFLIIIHVAYHTLYFWL